MHILQANGGNVVPHPFPGYATGGKIYGKIYATGGKIEKNMWKEYVEKYTLYKIYEEKINIKFMWKKYIWWKKTCGKVYATGGKILTQIF